MVAYQEPIVVVQEVIGWAAESKWLRSSKSMAGGPRNQWLGSGPGNQWLESRTSMVGGQEPNGWGPGNQWLVPRKPEIRDQEIKCWGPGNQWLRSRKSMVPRHGMDTLAFWCDLASGDFGASPPPSCANGKTRDRAITGPFSSLSSPFRRKRGW